tara:strand:- start:230 stop:682 length:453 start_codon:yes stop_codon:yes gene_type:complete
LNCLTDIHYIEEIIGDGLIGFLRDDPVRPLIPLPVRITNNKSAYVLFNDNDCCIDAVVCVAYTDRVLTKEIEVYEDCTNPSIAMFYTVWSYKPGAGRKVILAVRDMIIQEKPEIQRFITLSPQTDMARRFHLRNGAIELQINENTVNFEY